MTNPPGRSSSREKLLDAAADLISKHSVQEMTLEGVAAAAGVTKGGLIYHFKTKDELLGALVERMIEQLDQRSRDKAAKRGDTTSALLQALVDDAFDMPGSEKLLLTNLLAAVTSYPHLLGPVQQSYDRLYGEFVDAGPQAGLALAITAALDGLSLLELLNLHKFSKRQREAMREALQQLAQTVT
jgi:AcrR family transcriptional regulator